MCVLVVVQGGEVLGGGGENGDRSAGAVREQMGENRHVFGGKNRQRRQEFLEQQAEEARQNSADFHSTTIIILLHQISQGHTFSLHFHPHIDRITKI